MDLGHIKIAIRHPHEKIELEALDKHLELKRKVQDGDINREIINK